MEVIEQMTYLLFIKRLDELHTVREKKVNRLKRPIEKPIFNAKQQALRWSHFKAFGAGRHYFGGLPRKIQTRHSIPHLGHECASGAPCAGVHPK